MELTESLLVDRAGEYERTHPLFVREQDHLDTLPEAFASGEYGWKDVEWVVRWYFRRYLGAYPDGERRETENAFGKNEFDDVRDAIAAARDAADTEAKIRRLTTLSGVDVAVASALLQFTEPTSYVVVDDRAWETLFEADELDEPAPESLSPADYERYRSTCQRLADRFDCSLLTVYRALWQLGSADA